ncbi:formate--tetrahydrofolate ligase [Flavobacterium celericrescens]|uniref:Formate--tetrahydrofolate ligase n=1 Tax=Flavobacterium celericrescens TaxID=2709780 RepID=A0ABX0IEK3_9FLAO|nr:formate--tetrahydrofolate ligase [Flavobacterium celericrescens]NHM04289.1 formate--tetrahydrofolate ligase [Flavobacterium celericrescens]
MSTFPSDIEIAQNAMMSHIKDIAKKINISEDDLEFYGKYKAKLPLHLQQENPKGKLILVSAMSPTKYGEGKTTMSIGLTDGLNYIGKKAIAVLREPSLGPVFGLKGGAAGGGYVQVLPMEDINLHFTGDFSAIEKANNLLSAVIDNNLQNTKYSLNLDPKSIAWKRVMDMNDRSLRQIIIGVGAKANGTMREDGFNITPASEVMAILCLAKDLEDLKFRLGNIFVGKTLDGKAIFARDLNVVGAMATLLKDAIKPNLVQTIDGNPAILHGGPFASIAQGTNTAIATKMGLSLSDYVVTEAGFGADLGAEKFLHIKCEQSGLKPDAVVLVATIRAIKHHAGLAAEDFKTENVSAIEKGFCNLEKHIENMQQFGLNPVVCINAFPDDTQAEYDKLKELCATKGVTAIVSTAFAQGGKGSAEVAQKVVEEIEKGTANYQPLYQPSDSIEHKINVVAKTIYGANSVEFSPKSKAQLKMINDLGFGHFSICMAKTPASFSDNEKLIGRPSNFDITVREFEIASGAGFIVPLLGEVMRMPGLPAVPNAERIDIDNNGVITGLS